MIDDFNQFPLTAPDSVLDNQAVWASRFAGDPVLGQYRVIGNYMIEAPLEYNFSATIVDSGVFSITNSAVTRSVGQIIWQASTITPGTNSIIAHPNGFDLGNVNFDTLLSSPNFNFQWSVINADDRNWEYTIRAYTSNADNYYEAMIASNQSGITLSLPRDAFTAVGSPDWTSINAVAFAAVHSDGLLGGDLAIDNVILAVPEVSSYLLLGATVGFVVGYYYLFRRKQSADHNHEETQAAFPGLNCALCGKAFFSAKKHRQFCTKQ